MMPGYSKGLKAAYDPTLPQNQYPKTFQLNDLTWVTANSADEEQALRDGDDSVAPEVEGASDPVIIPKKYVDFSITSEVSNIGAFLNEETNGENEVRRRGRPPGAKNKA